MNSNLITYKTMKSDVGSHNEDLVEIISISTEVWQEVHVLTKILFDLEVG